jgi:hypothetical protein
MSVKGSAPSAPKAAGPRSRTAPALPSAFGYSGTPLVKKLGIKDGFRVALVDAPPSFLQLLDPLPTGVVARPLRPPVSKGRSASSGATSSGATSSSEAGPVADLVVAFFTERAAITESWASLTGAVGPLGTIWVAWPKKTSGVVSDITEDVFRDELLATGWVDVKVCAIDATWSALKFVLRKELRP